MENELIKDQEKKQEDFKFVKRDLSLKNVENELEMQKLKREYNISDDDIVFKFFKIYEKQQQNLIKCIKAQEDLQKNNINVNTLLQQNLLKVKEIDAQKITDITKQMNKELEEQIWSFWKTTDELVAKIADANYTLKQQQHSLAKDKEKTLEIVNKAQATAEKAEETADDKKIITYISSFLTLLNTVLIFLIFIEVFIKEV